MTKDLIVDITTRDGKTNSHICSDFPHNTGRYFVLSLKGFKTKYIPDETIEQVNTYFK